MKRFLLGIVGILTVLSAQSQTIKIELSHFGGKSYNCLVVYGQKYDTVAKGKLDQSGKAIINFNGRFKGYKGMSRFLLDDGGGLEIVINNNENFTIRCTEEMPNVDNIKFIGSPENEYFVRQSLKQQQLLRKSELAAAVLATYKSNDPVYPPFEKEQQQLEVLYKSLKSSNAQSPLYAARMMEIFDFQMGSGSSLKLGPEEKMTEANAFVLSKLDIDVLYNSGQWNSLLDNWFNLQMEASKDDTILFNNVQQLAARIKSNEQYTAFSELMVKQLAKVGKDELVSAFGTAIAASGKIEQPSHYLLAAMGGPHNGMSAPELVWAAGNHAFDKKQKTVLVFYESGCNNCDNEMNLLIGNYKMLQKRGYEVVSVTSDIDKTVNESTTNRFPWKYKYCDYLGTAGYNFISYGVIGTPTIFVIDEEGNITGRYARLVDANVLN